MSTEQSQLDSVVGNIASEVATLKTGVAAMLAQINALVTSNAQGVNITADLATLQQTASDLAGVNSEISAEQNPPAPAASSAPTAPTTPTS